MIASGVVFPLISYLVLKPFSKLSLGMETRIGILELNSMIAITGYNYMYSIAPFLRKFQVNHTHSFQYKQDLSLQIQTFNFQQKIT